MQLADTTRFPLHPPLPVKQVPESSYSNALPTPDPLGVRTPNGAAPEGAGRGRGAQASGTQGSSPALLRVPAARRPSLCLHVTGVEGALLCAGL